MPYEEFDTHNPLSVYGRSKSCGEKLIEYNEALAGNFKGLLEK